MVEVTNELMYQLLKPLHTRMDQQGVKLDEIKSELQAIRQHQLATSQEVGNIYGKLARHDDQLDRIEKRLDLIEPAH
jgi:predicted  nucleic acid-binding Zn-ribbon protein